MESLWQDARYAIRSLVKQPAFAAVVLVTVGLGVGANTAMFSILHTVLLRPLPYERPEALVAIYQADRLNHTRFESASGPDYADYLERQTRFADLAAYTGANPTLADGVESPERVNVAMVTASLFPTLRVGTALGRFILPEEDVAGGRQVAVLSHGFWRRRFGADSGVVGSTITLDGTTYQVVGVAASTLLFPPGSAVPTDVFVPLQYDPTTASRGIHNLRVLGRLGPGVTVSAAQAEMASIMNALEGEYPNDNVGRGANVVSLMDAVTGTARPVLVLLMGAVGLLLLLMSFNVANLLLARGASRGREMALRAAIGADRARLFRQLLVESLVLASVGGLVGIGLAAVALRAVRSLDPGTLPRISQVTLDPLVIGFGMAAALGTGLVFGLLPAIAGARTNLLRALAQGGRGAAGRQSARLRHSLAVVQVAIAFVLVIGAGLLIRSMWNLLRVDPGFRVEHLARVSVNLPSDRYPNNFRNWPDVPEVTQFHQAILDRVRRLPNVEAAALAVNHPLNPGWTSRIQFPGGPTTVEEGVEEERIRPVSPGYFGSIGTPLLAGRDFDARDRGGAPAVVIVNESFVDKYFPEGEVVGKRLQFWGAEREIVGVVGDVRFMGIGAGSEPAVYGPMGQLPFSQFDVIARGTGDPGSVLNAVRGEIQQLDPQLAIFNVQRFDDILSASLASQRLNAVLLGVFAGLALALAAVGIYGVIAYGVSQRTQEIGVRMSLGADRGRVRRMILGEGLRLAGAGIALGIGGALFATRAAAGLLYGVGAVDPLTWGAVGAFLLGVVVMSSLVPARRASRVEPVVALREG